MQYVRPFLTYHPKSLSFSGLKITCSSYVRFSAKTYVENQQLQYFYYLTHHINNLRNYRELDYLRLYLTFCRKDGFLLSSEMGSNLILTGTTIQSSSLRRVPSFSWI